VADRAGPAGGPQLLLDRQPEPMSRVGATNVMRADSAVDLGNDDGERVGDVSSPDFTLEQRLLLFVEVEHGVIVGSADILL
jgi:hypothetical protein